MTVTHVARSPRITPTWRRIVCDHSQAAARRVETYSRHRRKKVDMHAVGRRRRASGARGVGRACGVRSVPHPSALEVLNRERSTPIVGRCGFSRWRAKKSRAAAIRKALVGRPKPGSDRVGLAQSLIEDEGQGIRHVGRATRATAIVLQSDAVPVVRAISTAVVTRDHVAEWACRIATASTDRCCRSGETRVGTSPSTSGRCRRGQFAGGASGTAS